MKTRLLLAATIATGIAAAPAAFAADDMKKSGMSKDKMEKMEKKDGMTMSSDNMKKTGDMMHKKDGMAKDGMKK
jgi:pentapeptide MXKDX repeat protein